MKKKTIKILLVMMMLIVAFTVTVSAAESKTSGQNPSNYVGGGAQVGQIETLGNKIIQIVSVVGSIASVIVLVILGIKYMMGSAEEKAEYKKTLLPYIIGAALVFAASSIAGIVFNFATSL